MTTSVFVLSVFLFLGIDTCFGETNNECVTYKQFVELQSRHEQRIESLEKRLQDKPVSGRAIDGEGVAFSVILSGTVHHLGLKQPIRFNSIQLNENNGYNQYTGVFTAPKDGVYLFSYFLGHGAVGQVWLELMHNGYKINAGVADGFDGGEDDQSGNVSVVRLTAGVG